MSTQDDKNEKIAEQLAANNSKGALIEKLVFAGLPIMFSCIVYLMAQLSTTSHDLTVLQSKIAVVVNQDNKAIPPQGTTIDMASIRETLNSKIDKGMSDLGDKIDKVEKDAALARAGMTLEREKQLAMLEKQRMEMTADAAQARAAIRADGAALANKLTNDLSDHVDANERNAALARAELDKRLALLELNVSMIKSMIGKTK